MLQINEKVNDNVPPFGPPDEPPFAGEYNPPQELPQQTVIRGFGIVNKQQVLEILEQRVFSLSELCKNKKFEALAFCLREQTLFDLINAAHNMVVESEREIS